MATIRDYLDKKISENPEYAFYDYEKLYKELKNQNDQNLPYWESFETQTSRKKSKYEIKQNPDFVNSLFDWTDWGINENSAEWAKSAYNNSITGLAYQYYNGDQRFNLDKYNPGIAEDIFSAVLSFSMPLDFLSMWAGGAIGKGFNSLAGIGMKEAAVNNIVKLSGKGLSKELLAKETAEELAIRTSLAKLGAEKLINEKGYSALFSQYAPRAAGSIGQSATLATFEGARGGLQAAVNGEDVWAGIGHGVAHGGIMGAAAGFVGASLNVKHAELFAKASKKGNVLTRAEERALGFWQTGKGGQVLAEAGIFTAPEVKNLIMDEDYTMRDLFKSFATNVGMMGILKAKHHLWGEAKTTAIDYYKREKARIDAERAGESALKNVQKEANKKEVGETKDQESYTEGLEKATNDFIESSIEKTKVSRKEYDGIEERLKKADKAIEEGSTDVKDLTNTYEIIQEAYGAMAENIKNFKTDNPIETNASKIELAKLEGQKKKFEDEILKKINDVDLVQKRNTEFDDATRHKAKFNFIEAIKQAKESGNKDFLDLLTKKEDGTPIEGWNPKTQTMDWSKAITAEFKPLAESFLGRKTITADTGIVEVSKGKEKDFVKESIESNESVRGYIESQPGVTDKASRRKVLQRDTNIQKKEYRKVESFDPKDKKIKKLETKESKAYDESKIILSKLARETLMEKGQLKSLKGQLNHMEDLARFMADRGKSLFEVTQKDITQWLSGKVESGGKIKGRSTIKWALRNIAESYRKIVDELNLEGIRPKNVFKNANENPFLKGDIKKLADKLFKKVEQLADEPGLQVPGGQYSTLELKDNTLITSGKGKSLVKYVTEKLIDSLDWLSKKVIRNRDNSPQGHKDFMFKDVGNHALTTEDVNILTREIFGKSAQKGDAGEGRLFRKSIEQWAITKKDGSIKEADSLTAKQIVHIVDKWIVGHQNISVAETYQLGMTSGNRKFAADKILKQYIEDIRSGKKEFDKTFDEGYSNKQIRKGLEKLDGVKDSDQIKIEGNRYVDGKTLKIMFDYMIQTGPRLNEIAPTKSDLKAFENQAKLDYAESKQKIDYQLETELKSAETIVKQNELSAQAEWVKKKYPQLAVQLEKSLGKVRGRHVMGQIQGQLIKIATGKARIDTLPHEVSHHVVDALKAAGDPFSKNLVKQGIKMFGSEEAFVEALGKYSAKTLNKSMMGRVGSWVKRAWSRLRQYFGITSAEDAVRAKREIVEIIGGKVLSGKVPMDYLPVKSQIKVKYQMAGENIDGKKPTKAEMKRIKAKNIEIHETELELMKSPKDGGLGFTKTQIRSLREDLMGKGFKLKLSDVTYGELETLNNRLNSLATKRLEGKSQELSKNEVWVEDLEIRYDISNEMRNKFFDKAFKTTIENATPEQIKAYRSFIRKGREVTPSNEYMIDDLNTIVSNETNAGVSLFKRAINTSSDVLRIAANKIGGDAGKGLKKIAESLDMHDYARTRFKGEGEVAINRINNIVDKATKKKYMHLIDPELARNSLTQLKELSDKRGGKFTVEYNEAKNAILDFSKGGKHAEAREIWNEISTWYWNQLGVEISRHTKGQREFQKIMSELNSKFIQNYFVRRVRKEVVEFINTETPEIQRMIKDNLRDLSKSDLERAAKALDVSKGSKEYEAIMNKNSKALDSLVANEIMSMFEYGPAKVKPAFLKTRGNTLPEYIEIKTKDGRRKLVKSYETSLDGTINHYVNGMSMFLATVRHFPEFTELAGKFSIRGNQKIRTLDAMAKNQEIGAYAYQLIKTQLGMDYSMKDVLTSKPQYWAGKLTNISALVGLSSPLAGIKNFIIQIPRSVALYGTRNTAKAVKFAMSSWRNPKAFEDAIRRGETGYGQKEVIAETGTGKEAKLIKFWFENVNLMTQTENFNRIVLAEAGRLHFSELTNLARGTKSLFHPKGKKADVLRMFKETWKLNESDIDFILNGKDIYGTKRFQDILDFVGHQSHKAGAGATGAGDLPLWFSSKYIKPFTLFQRMATSVTIDSYKNYIKPLKNGNIAPLLKATIGHGMAGASLFFIYDKFLGQQIPVEENEAIDKIMANIWRGEMLGVFGEILSPYGQNVNPLMEPVVLRNVKAAGNELLSVLKYNKGLDQALKDFALNTVVLASQADKAWKKMTHPYAVGDVRMKTLSSQFQKQMGYSKPHAEILSYRQSYYHKLKQAIILGKSDEEVAHAYYAAFNAICNEAENIKNISYKNKRIKEAKKSLDAVIRHMNPINVSDEGRYRIDSKRNEFLNWLSPKNKKLALDLEKTYHVKIRRLKRIINSSKWRDKYSVYPY